MDWNLILTALSVIFSFCVLLTAIYYRVYIPREKAKEEKRVGIYKPLLKDVDALIEKVGERKAFSPPFNWKTVEDKVSTYLYVRLQKLFEDKYENYFKLLQHNQNFIRYEGYFYLNYHLSELQKEFKSLGVGALEYELYNTIVTSVLEGEKITLNWIEENNPELYEHLTRCPSYKKLKTLLDWLNEENPCIVSLRMAERDLLNYAEELKDELKKF